MRIRNWLAALWAAALVTSIIGTLAISGEATPRAHTVLWKDSFNGSTLDATKWHVGWFGNGVDPTPGVSGSEDDCYAPGQVQVGGGQLKITATKQACLGKAWTSGLIDTDGKFSFTTGTLKAQICYTGDDWPGVWTDGQSWPNDGEIDLFEGLHGHGEAHVHDHAHGTQGPYGDLGVSCHKIRYVRTASAVTFFYDGKKVGTAIASGFSTSPHYLVINLAVSSSISPPEVAAQFYVNWIEVTT